MSSPRAAFERKKHVAFWLRNVRMLPQPYQGADTQRVAIAYFCLSALDLLGEAQGQGGKITDEERREWCDWIYSQQLPASAGGGFRGSPSMDQRLVTGDAPSTSRETSLSFDPANLAMCYTALLLLAILRDDFSRLDKEGLKEFVASMQAADGSFASSPSILDDREQDVRFVFTAFAICYMLNDWSFIDAPAALAFLEKCRTYEGSYAVRPRLEGHGGSTYCTLAALVLASRQYPSSLASLLSLDSPARKSLLRWLLGRQYAAYPVAKSVSAGSAGSMSSAPGGVDSKMHAVGSNKAAHNEGKEEDGEDEDGDEEEEEASGHGGFQGRLEKPADSCYSFWVGASIHMLGEGQLMNAEADVVWLLSNQTLVGGFTKVPGEHPDAMHSYLALAALSMHDHFLSTEQQAAPLHLGLLPLDPALNVSEPTAEWIREKLWVSS